MSLSVPFVNSVQLYIYLLICNKPSFSQEYNLLACKNYQKTTTQEHIVRIINKFFFALMKQFNLYLFAIRKLTILLVHAYYTLYINEKNI